MRQWKLWTVAVPLNLKKGDDMEQKRTGSNMGAAVVVDPFDTLF